MKLESLSPPDGARKRRKRIGRGPGSGLGKTAGRGHNGQKSRSGYSRKRGFEGGQMPLVRRVPKRGFHNLFSTELSIINVKTLERFAEGTIVNAELLLAEKCVKKLQDGIKILGNGEISKGLVVQAQAFSASAKSKIEAAGGRAEVVSLKGSPASQKAAEGA